MIMKAIGLHNTSQTHLPVLALSRLVVLTDGQREIMSFFKQKGKGRAKPTTIRLLCWILEVSRSPLLVDIPNNEIDVSKLERRRASQVWFEISSKVELKMNHTRTEKPIRSYKYYPYT